MRCDDVQRDLALALLSGSQPDGELTAHAETCPDCASERASMQGLMGLLPLLSTADFVEARGEPSDALLQRLLEQVAAERARQRRRRRIGLTSALALAAAVVAIALASFSGVFTTAQHAILASASANGITATAHIDAADNGSELTLSIKGVPRGTRCVLRVVSTSARTETLTVWTADYYGTATTRGNAPFSPDEIARITVSRVDGPVLLSIPVVA